MIKDIVETVLAFPLLILLAIFKGGSKQQQCMMCIYEGTTRCPTIGCYRRQR